MISDDVRSTNGRPSASTPVTTRGTACTIRVLRRFLNSALALLAPSDTISIVSSAKLPLGSFIQTAAVPQHFKISRNRLKPLHLLHRITFRSTFRDRPPLLPLSEHPCSFRNPHCRT